MSTSDDTGSERGARDSTPGLPSDPEPPGDTNPDGRAPGRRGTARQVVVGTIVLVFMVAGVAVPLALLSGSFGTAPTIHPSGEAGAGATGSPVLPDTAVVGCTEQGTEVLTPVVRPQPDGVHFRTDNRTDRPLLFDVDEPTGGGFGTGAPPGVHPVEDDAGFPIAPGSVQVRCADADDPAWTDSPFSTLTVEDPDGLWMPGLGLEGCDRSSTTFLDHVQDAVGEQGDPVDLARDDLADTIEPGDEIRSAGYPEAHLPSVAVVREGRVVAVVLYASDGQGGWLLSQVNACSE
jgi:hypothetical protein